MTYHSNNNRAQTAISDDNSGDKDDSNRDSDGGGNNKDGGGRNGNSDSNSADGDGDGDDDSNGSECLAPCESKGVQGCPTLGGLMI
jgi:hypothetical protein